MKTRAGLGKEEGDREKRRGQTTDSNGDWERRKSQGSQDGDKLPPPPTGWQGRQTAPLGKPWFGGL